MAVNNPDVVWDDEGSALNAAPIRERKVLTMDVTVKPSRFTKLRRLVRLIRKLILVNHVVAMRRRQQGKFKSIIEKFQLDKKMVLAEYGNLVS